MKTEAENLTITLEYGRYDGLAAGTAGRQFVFLRRGWLEFADSWMEVIHALAQSGYCAVAVNQRGQSPRARPADA
ncbi:hypothetical protein ABZU76_51410 [Amycolatopsis sp. NPDC005232]|uniref:hypothetical protein n=1 Tax=Amycolatopsis sp. NPDC005232 TaxID=3157027 RepID=UPI0033B9548B